MCMWYLIDCWPARWFESPDVKAVEMPQKVIFLPSKHQLRRQPNIQRRRLLNDSYLSRPVDSSSSHGRYDFSGAGSVMPGVECSQQLFQCPMISACWLDFFIQLLPAPLMICCRKRISLHELGILPELIISLLLIFGQELLVVRLGGWCPFEAIQEPPALFLFFMLDGTDSDRKEKAVDKTLKNLSFLKL